MVCFVALTGVEPALPFGNWTLIPAGLPVPPQGHTGYRLKDLPQSAPQRLQGVTIPLYHLDRVACNLHTLEPWSEYRESNPTLDVISIIGTTGALLGLVPLWPP